MYVYVCVCVCVRARARYMSHAVVFIAVGLPGAATAAFTV
jgi:hypothetical protein